MKRHWLGGMSLLVSMALLLSGGVALAAGLTVTIDQECFECWPYGGDQVEASIGPEPPEEYRVTMTIRGFEVGDRFQADWTANGQWKGSASWTWINPPPATWDAVYVLCDDRELQDLYGEWIYSMRNPDTGDSTEVRFLFAEDYTAALFVPEPGSILLLGSGLAGLAGYATLRWRIRE